MPNAKTHLRMSMSIAICPCIPLGTWACQDSHRDLVLPGQRLRSSSIVDYYEASGHGAEHYCEWLNERKIAAWIGFRMTRRAREWGSGRNKR